MKTTKKPAVTSFVARYKRFDGGLMSGAVKSSESSRFGTRQEAEDRLWSAVELNGGPAVVDGQVVEVPGHPEIFAHCGVYSQALNCRCPGCGKVLTVKDAVEHARKRAGGDA